MKAKARTAGARNCAVWVVWRDGPTALHRWAKHRQSWLARHLALPHGIPARDCIRRPLAVFKPETFPRCFQAWIADAIPVDAYNAGRLVAIDGKTNRRSHDDAKSDEITATPQLWEQIDLAGTRITIDAMGCQQEIVNGGGDGVIAVKDN